MRASWGLVVCAVLIAAPGFDAEPAPATLSGYSAESSARERDWEAKLRAIPSPANLRADMERLTAHPHHLGSPYDKDNAEWMLERFRSWGLDAHIETFEVLMPTPIVRRVEMTAPTRFSARLEEPAVPGDPTSGQKAEQLPTYNAFSIDGDVEGPLVYVNYGLPADYKMLDRMGISVKGAIVIARYGHSWRGIKPKVAAEHGAVGCLIYSDPYGDGYSNGKTFPAGPFRPRDGVQRGSVTDTTFDGDPLTPGIGATKDAKRLAIKDSPLITKIPVLPISYGDAEPLLSALSGRVVPEAWRGTLPLDYRTGPGAARVHLTVRCRWNMVPLYDVVIRIPGAEEPETWIIRGNHHDAWAYGAEDPVSGTVSVMEEARAFSEMLKQGWKPRRTIFLCAWDGEEEGLFGSTEWAETHADELRAHAAVYINSDSNGRGTLGMGGSHSLEDFVNGVARDVEDPEKKTSVWKRLQLERIENAKSDDDRSEARSRKNLRIRALGDGSDYASFLDFLGVASLSFGYGGEDDGGIYHSIYDDFYWFTHFSDTDFVYGRALAQTAGTAVMRLADADLLPYEFTGLSDTLHRYVGELEKLLDKERDHARETNKEIDEGVFEASSDPREPMRAPERELVAPHLNFAPLENGADAVTASAERYEKAVAAFRDRGASGGRSPSLARVNRSLIATERALTSPDGLPRRAWFKHMIYATGAYTGYEVKTIPAVREAIEQHLWSEAEQQIARVGKVLDAEAAAIDAAAVALEQLRE